MRTIASISSSAKAEPLYPGGLLGSVAPADTNPAVAYAVPVDRTAEATLVVSNPTTGAVNASIYYDSSGVGATTANIVASAVSIPANQAAEFEFSKMQANHRIIVVSGTGTTLVFAVKGTEAGAL